MPKIIFHLSDTSVREVEVSIPTTVMQAAIYGDVRGIEAECGGACACATCHVYVDPAFVTRIPPAQQDELEMLEGVAADRLPNSRLACQIHVTEALDGLTVSIPDRQF
ncbi:2Fe-2S iron-sulfur cluster-binding protein [Gluconacetobacter tumulicola]|uniref:(2Fe-2S)-binding protein n=1 Tax=Gluconacetobacter tumulicola TaxID=1017177 RepID=A0A7W4P8G6_9PROT|nr:2Fe-2S iron-sulfur cluster-binding protein [Gluconacetobacter tumulicola]MBB2180974.1 (2Fe-2S)-binding protein [Gluconacetobacter tumulicola]